MAWLPLPPIVLTDKVVNSCLSYQTLVPPRHPERGRYLLFFRCKSQLIEKSYYLMGGMYADVPTWPRPVTPLPASHNNRKIRRVCLYTGNG